MRDNGESGCVNIAQCGNIVPGNGETCAECLDAARRRQREEQ